MSYKKMLEIDMSIQQKLLDNYEKTLSLMPKGALSYKKIKERICYYFVDEDTGKQHSLNRRKKDLIMQLKLKKQMQVAVRRIKENLKWQKKLLDHYQPYDAASIEESLSPAYRDDGLRAYEKQFLQTPEEWAAENYRANPYHQENLVIQTSFGLLVRTKSEAMIAELLHAAGIPFRYEPELKLKNRYGQMRIYYPDFVIMTPQGKNIFWEHAGLFHDEKYRNRFLEKNDTYFVNGIVQPSNYIVTMDGPDGSLDIEAIHQIIEKMLVPLFAE